MVKLDEIILQIKYEDIVFDRNVYSYCKNQNFTCPNYDHSWACPPASPFLKERLSEFQQFFLIGIKFDLENYIKEIQKKYPRRSREIIINKLYRNGIIEKELNGTIEKFLDERRGQFEDSFALWGGNCSLCTDEGKKCTYDEKEPCRFPDKIRYGLSAAGINTVETVKHLGIDLNWTNDKFTYRFGLICLN